jgi:hypothetical protein
VLLSVAFWIYADMQVSKAIPSKLENEKLQAEAVQRLDK